MATDRTQSPHNIRGQWLTLTAAALLHRIGGGQAGEAGAVRGVRLRGDNACGEPGLEGVGGMQRGDGPRRAPRRPACRPGRRKHFAEESKDRAGGQDWKLGEEKFRAYGSR